MRTVAVATGTFSVEQLARTGPDHVVPDLSATEEVVEILVR